MAEAVSQESIFDKVITRKPQKKDLETDGTTNHTKLELVAGNVSIFTARTIGVRMFMILSVNLRTG